MANKANIRLVSAEYNSVVFHANECELAGGFVTGIGIYHYDSTDAIPKRVTWPAWNVSAIHWLEDAKA